MTAHATASRRQPPGLLAPGRKTSPYDPTPRRSLPPVPPTRRQPPASRTGKVRKPGLCEHSAGALIVVIAGPFCRRELEGPIAYLTPTRLPGSPNNEDRRRPPGCKPSEVARSAVKSRAAADCGARGAGPARGRLAPSHRGILTARAARPTARRTGHGAPHHQRFVRCGCPADPGPLGRGTSDVLRRGPGRPAMPGQHRRFCQRTALATRDGGPPACTRAPAGPVRLAEQCRPGAVIPAGPQPTALEARQSRPGGAAAAGHRDGLADASGNDPDQALAAGSR
jgi:hypothetical protein